MLNFNRLKRSRSQKLQLKLTIQFALFFILVSGFIYFYFTNKFEGQINEKYTYKADVFINFFIQNPQVFSEKKFTDPEILQQLLFLNGAVYLVVEGSNGDYLDALNLEAAEKNLYILTQDQGKGCLLYTSPSPRDRTRSRMPSSA